MKQFGIK